MIDGFIISGSLQSFDVRKRQNKFCKLTQNCNLSALLNFTSLYLNPNSRLALWTHFPRKALESNLQLHHDLIIAYNRYRNFSIPKIQISKTTLHPFFACTTFFTLLRCFLFFEKYYPAVKVYKNFYHGNNLRTYIIM